MKQKLSNPSSHSVLSAWQAQLQVAQDPHLKQQLLQQEGELLPRFAEQYQKLSSLPCGCDAACNEDGSSPSA
jgi:hypothetical protein